MLDQMMEFDQQPATPDVRPETIAGCVYYNLSRQPTGRVINMLNGLKPLSVVILPDISEGRSPIPTGCVVELDTRQHPEWRQFASGDVGCGMQVLTTDLSRRDFNKLCRRSWDSLALALSRQSRGSLGDLGRGNHFVDAAVDSDGRVYVIIHSGSRERNRSLSSLATSPDEFDELYNECLTWSRSNRDAIAQMIQDRFGHTTILCDTTHNFHIEDTENHRVLIYSGAVRLKPDNLSVLPSSMNGDMALVIGAKSETGSKTHYAVSHGTGRTMSRSDGRPLVTSRMVDKLRRIIYIPRLVGSRSLYGEHPVLYADLESTLELLSNQVKVEKTLKPIAYIGQL